MSRRYGVMSATDFQALVPTTGRVYWLALTRNIVIAWRKK